MDKNAIKKYAVWARRELIERVSQRAMIYGITAKDVGDPNAESVNGYLLSQAEKRQRQALIRNIKTKGYEQVMEVPQIQRLKTAVGADVSARMTPVLRKAKLEEEKKQLLSREAAGASERMLNHLLFGMRARLSDEAFRECLDAMEHVMNE